MVIKERIRDLESKLSASVPRSELDAVTSEAQVRIGKLTGRVRELEAKLAETIPRTELEAKQFETERLLNELAKLRDDKAQSEANMEKLANEGAMTQGATVSRSLELALPLDHESPDRSNLNMKGRLAPLVKSMLGYIRVKELWLENYLKDSLRREIQMATKKAESCLASVTPASKIGSPVSQGPKPTIRAESEEIQNDVKAFGMKLCENCGTQLTEGTRFCYECGAEVKSAQVTRHSIPSPYLTVEQSLPVKTNTAQRWLEEGTALYDSGDVSEAVQCYDRIIQMDANNTDAWFLKGVALVDLDRLYEAIECYDRVIQIDPSRAEPWFCKGAAFNALNKHHEAVECYTKASQIDPKDVNVWYGIGAELVLLGKYDEAIQDFDRAIELDPNCTNALYYKGELLGYLNNFVKAKECFDRVIQIDPNYAMFRGDGYQFPPKGWYDKSGQILLEKLIQLKALLDSRAITREEFEERKRTVQISKLHSMLDSGAITKAQFETQKDLLTRLYNLQPGDTLEAIEAIRQVAESTMEIADEQTKKAYLEKEKFRRIRKAAVTVLISWAVVGLAGGLFGANDAMTAFWLQLINFLMASSLVFAFLEYLVSKRRWRQLETTFQDLRASDVSVP